MKGAINVPDTFYKNTKKIFEKQLNEVTSNLIYIWLLAISFRLISI